MSTSTIEILSDVLEFTPSSELSFKISYEIKSSLENAAVNTVILNFINSDYIDSTIIGTILTIRKKGKSVIIKIKKDSYVEEVLIMYGLINVLQIEYI